MKVCCGNGKPHDTLTDIERIGGCSTDHCIGPIGWDKWITLQIKQDSVDNYKVWYENMLKRGAACDELIEAHNKLFGEKG